MCWPIPASSSWHQGSLLTQDAAFHLFAFSVLPPRLGFLHPLPLIALPPRNPYPSSNLNASSTYKGLGHVPALKDENWNIKAKNMCISLYHCESNYGSCSKYYRQNIWLNVFKPLKPLSPPLTDLLWGWQWLLYGSWCYSGTPLDICQKCFILFYILESENSGRGYSSGVEHLTAENRSRRIIIHAKLYHSFLT